MAQLVLPYEEVNDEDIADKILREFDLVITKLKDQKVPSIDDMPDELIRAAGNYTSNALY